MSINLSETAKLSFNSTARTQGIESSAAHDDGSLYTEEQDADKGRRFERYRPGIRHWDDAMDTAADDFDAYLTGEDKLVHDAGGHLVMVDKASGGLVYADADGNYPKDASKLRPLGRSVAAERRFDESVLVPRWEKSQEGYRKRRQWKRMKSFDDWKRSMQSRGRCKLRESIVQVGNTDIPDSELSFDSRVHYTEIATRRLIQELEAVGAHVSSVDFHVDEASPHFQIRYYAPPLEEAGEPSFEALLRSKGIEPTAPDASRPKNKGKPPTALNTWTAKVREEMEDDVDREMAKDGGLTLNRERTRREFIPNPTFKGLAEQADADAKARALELSARFTEAEDAVERQNERADAAKRTALGRERVARDFETIGVGREVGSGALRTIKPDNAKTGPIIERMSSDDEDVSLAAYDDMRRLLTAGGDYEYFEPPSVTIKRQKKASLELSKASCALEDVKKDLEAEKASLEALRASQASEKAAWEAEFAREKDAEREKAERERQKREADEKARLQELIDEAAASRSEELRELTSKVRSARADLANARSDALFLGTLPEAQDLVEKVELSDAYLASHKDFSVTYQGVEWSLFEAGHVRDTHGLAQEGDAQALLVPPYYVREDGSALWLPTSELYSVVDTTRRTDSGRFFLTEQDIPAAEAAALVDGASKHLERERQTGPDPSLVAVLRDQMRSASYDDDGYGLSL